MKLCFPVKNALEIESEVYGHFGSAPAFILVDTNTGMVLAIPNPDQHHVKGMCSPMKTLAGLKVDGIVVGGIGGGALKKLTQAGITVYRAMARTVGENLVLLEAGQLSVFKPDAVCSGHIQGCAHS
jgi:predicted Fe-Mo cluster-binding NifX family protein